MSPLSWTSLDPRVCYRAIRTRDDRFDGRLFVGVTTTGIYCRPVCPAGPARFENCRFFTSAAAAQEAGFRPCLRCRPETAPDLGSWRGTANTVGRGLALIADGQLDRGGGGSVDALAERLGVGGRQLRRLFNQHLGASPVAVAQTRRVLLAKQLIHDTRLPMAEVAQASGFGSVRRFNEAFRRLYDRPPTALRRRSAEVLPAGSAAVSGVTVRLRYRPPYDWEAMLSHLRGRAVEGVEHVGARTYTRTIEQDGQEGLLEVGHLPEAHSLTATIRLTRLAGLPAIIARIRRAFDLGADVREIGAHLSADAMLAPLIGARPGLRVPGGWDGFELGVRAILGQQVSVEAARRLAGKVVRLCGAPVSRQLADLAGGRLARLFPGPGTIAAADLGPLPMPDARRRALRALAEAARADSGLFQASATVEETVSRLREIPGIGDWTAHAIALRAAREPDAFPAADAGLLRGAAARDGAAWNARTLQARAEHWRPWRSYAAQHLWTADGLGRSANPGDPL